MLPATIPHDDTQEFAMLAEECRADVMAKLRVMAQLAGCSRGIGSAIASHACTLGISAKRLRALWDEFRVAGDWRVLINRRKFPVQGDDALPAEFVEFWRTLCERNQRKCKPAYKSLVRQWQRWRAGDPNAAIPGFDSPPDGVSYPLGASYRTLMRLRSTNFEMEAMQNGLGAALAKHGPMHLTTRVGLWVGSHFLFDDLLRDIQVLFVGRASMARIQELGALDVFSACRFAVHRRPQYQDGDRKDSLKEVEMRYLVAAVLRNTGYSPRGTVIPAERGTAAIRKPLANFLHAHSGGRITVQEAGITGRIQAITGWSGRGGGNPRHKARLESLHNLLHNEAANLPAATGHDRNPPEWLHGLCTITQQVIEGLKTLPPHQAELLIAPMVEYWQACDLLTSIDKIVNERTDHELEGWLELNHVVVEYREDPRSDYWLTNREFLSLPDHRQHLLQVAARHEPLYRRARKMSPAEVWAKGAGELVRFPDHIIAMMFVDRNLGDDLRVPRRLDAHNYFDVSDKLAGPERMKFSRFLTLPDGSTRQAQERTDYATVLNPFDPDTLWVYGPAGEYLGASARVVAVNPLSIEDTQAALGARSHEIAALLAPLRERHANVSAEILALQEHNRAVIAGEPVTPEAKEKAREDRRRIRRQSGDLGDLLHPLPTDINAPKSVSPVNPVNNVPGEAEDLLCTEPSAPSISSDDVSDLL